MWPILIRSLTRYSPYVTLPFAGFIGFLGYNIENYFSDKYTPYSEAITDKRSDRLITDESLNSAADVAKLKYKANVLNTNLSPSLTQN